ncbi:MAG: hypothetical protein GX621_09425 [Pirellulaceae bacterium]|nr:hypothetical protein [Pirellulaceae bacterium]
MFCELFGPLVGLAEQWLQQGASEDEIAMTAFDWDYVPYVDCGGTTGAFGTPAPKILDDCDEYRLETDYLGRVVKLCKATATIPLPLDFPVKSMDDWLTLKPLFAFDEKRLDDDAIDAAKAARREGAVVCCAIPGGWDTMRELMGDENACMAYYLQPELIRDILDTLTDTCTKVLERVTDRITVDQLSAHEDMAGKSGPLLGPSQVSSFIAPYYRACWDVASSRGARLFNQDSDGNMMPVLDAFLDAGVNMMHPFEPAAGMDIVEVRRLHGTRLAMAGGIDKHVLRRTKEEIDRELEYKMQPSLRAGGTIFGLDHRIPNGTPLENYRHYVRRGREILGLPPLDSRRRGWGRMAF